MTSHSISDYIQRALSPSSLKNNTHEGTALAEAPLETSAQEKTPTQEKERKPVQIQTSAQTPASPSTTLATDLSRRVAKHPSDGRQSPNYLFRPLPGLNRGN